MITQKRCPSCGTTHTVELPHEWPKIQGKLHLRFIQKSQSMNQDEPKLEALVPMAPDGQELVVEAQHIEDGSVLFDIYRRPLVGGVSASTVLAKPKTRADLETEAAECGVKVNPKWNDLQLQTAIKAAANAPVPAV